MGGADTDDGNAHVQPFGDSALRGKEDGEAHEDDGSACVRSCGDSANHPLKSDCERPPRPHQSEQAQLEAAMLASKLAEVAADMTEQAQLEAAILASQLDEAAASMVPRLVLYSDDEIGLQPDPPKKRRLESQASADCLHLGKYIEITILLYSRLKDSHLVLYMAFR